MPEERRAAFVESLQPNFHEFAPSSALAPHEGGVLPSIEIKLIEEAVLALVVRWRDEARFLDKSWETEVLTVGIVCAVLLLLTSSVHYEALRLLTAGLPKIALPGRSKLVVVILGTFLAHGVELFLYAVAYWVLSHFFGAGSLRSPDGATFSVCLYFSAETYTSLGYGDIVPTGALRLLAGMEALNGLLLIGWTASYTYIAMGRLWDAASEQLTGK